MSMNKWGERFVDFILNDSDSQARNHLADTLVTAEGFSVKRAELESKEYLQLCKEKDTDALRRIMESGIPTLRLYAARELSVLGDIEAIAPLLRCLETTRTEPKSRAYMVYREALSGLMILMAAVPQPEHLPHYLDLLRWQKRYRLPIKPLVKALTQIAINWPSSELREALPFLKNYPEARQVIEASLLPGARLPIPAELAPTIENLPRPALADSSEPNAEELPIPSLPIEEPPRSFWKRLLGKD